MAGLEDTVIVKAREKRQGMVIFLHGAGDSGPGIHHWTTGRMRTELSFPHLDVMYPTASPRPYSPCGRQLNHVWFDFPKGIHQNVPEDVDGIHTRTEEIQRLLDEHIQQGTPPSKLILGGLSQGGILALHAGLTYQYPLAGIFVLSSYLPPESVLFPKLGADSVVSGSVPVYMAHGDSDPLIRCEWGSATHKQLLDRSVNTTFKIYERLQHDMCKEELLDLQEWILSKIPPCDIKNVK